MQSATANAGALPQPPNAPLQQQGGRLMNAPSQQQAFAGPFSIKDYGHTMTADPLRSAFNSSAFSSNTSKYTPDNRTPNNTLGDSYRGYTQPTTYASHNRGGGYPRSQIYGGMQQHRQQVQQQPPQVQGQQSGRRFDTTYSRVDDNTSTQVAPASATATYDDTHWARTGQPPQLKEPAPAARPQRRDHFQRREDFFAGTSGVVQPQAAAQATVSQYEAQHQPRIQSEASASSAPVLDEGSNSNSQATRQSVWTLSADQLGGVKPGRSAAEFTSPADVRMALSVAGEFTFHYFQLMQTQPHMLHHFYCADSQLAHGSTVWQHSKWNRAVGEHDIAQLFANMLHGDKDESSLQQGVQQTATGAANKQSVIIRANVKTLEAQPTRDGGIVMQATGIIETRDLGPRPFAHTIVMHRAPEAGSYVVLHDIFVFLDDLSTTPPLATAVPFNPTAVWRSTHSTESSAATAAPAAVPQGVAAPMPLVTPIALLATPPVLASPVGQTSETVVEPPSQSQPVSSAMLESMVANMQSHDAVVAGTTGPLLMSAASDSANLDPPPLDPPRRAPSPMRLPVSAGEVVDQRPPSETMRPQFDASSEAVSEPQSAVEEVLEAPVFEAAAMRNVDTKEMGVIKKNEVHREEGETSVMAEEEAEKWSREIGETQQDQTEEIQQDDGAEGGDEIRKIEKFPAKVPAAPWKNVSRIPPTAAKLPQSESVVAASAPQAATAAPVASVTEQILEADEEVQQHHTAYAPNSYAARLLQGVSTLPRQRGTVVKRARESAPTTPSTREQSSGNHQLSEAYHSKAVWVAQVDQVTNAQIEQAVALRLKGCLVEGRVVRIERMRNGPAGVIELDSEECVPMLLEKGLCLNGREVRIDLYKQGSPPQGQVAQRSDSPRQNNGPRKQQQATSGGVANRSARQNAHPGQQRSGEVPTSARQNAGRGNRGAGNRSEQRPQPTPTQTANAGATNEEWHAVGKRYNRKPGGETHPRVLPSGTNTPVAANASK